MLIHNTDQLDKYTDKKSIKKCIELLGRFASNCPNNSSFFASSEILAPRESKSILSPVLDFGASFPALA